MFNVCMHDLNIGIKKLMYCLNSIDTLGQMQLKKIPMDDL